MYLLSYTVYTIYIYIQAFGGMHSVDTVEVQISKRQ